MRIPIELVTRWGVQHNDPNPLGSGLRQSCGMMVVHHPYVATKPKARSPMGFLFGAATRTPHVSSGPQVGPLGRKPRHGMQPCDW